MNQRNDRSGQQLPPWMEAGRMEFMLRAELAFWRELVESCGADASAESVERMRQAAALAEYRLLELYRAPEHESRSTTCPARTSGSGPGALS